MYIINTYNDTKYFQFFQFIKQFDNDSKILYKVNENNTMQQIMKVTILMTIGMYIALRGTL